MKKFNLLLNLAVFGLTASGWALGHLACDGLSYARLVCSRQMYDWQVKDCSRIIDKAKYLDADAVVQCENLIQKFDCLELITDLVFPLGSVQNCERLSQFQSGFTAANMMECLKKAGHPLIKATPK